ncbi:MAG: hypothetical protein SH850_15570 [Planctomycetaceae bacterium]|nr:hypothetical protein [Planctomycetaceae bacterium]
MNNLPFPVGDRAELYAKQHGLTIEKQIGGGVDGLVQGTDRKTAIKTLNNHHLYRQERDVYRHFRRRKVSNVNGFQIPTLVDVDDELWVIEMTVVSPPFIVDFASASLIRRTEFEPEIRAEWMEAKEEQFEGDWPRVKMAMWALDRIGVFLNDVHPGNVCCR